MSNRIHSAPQSLDARQTITAGLRERLRDLPASPFDWNAFDPVEALRGSHGTADLRLASLAKLLCSAPARERELQALWNECLVTAAFALCVAPRVGADGRASAMAGLLHRLGDMLTVRAIAGLEQDSHLRLDAASKADLCAHFGVEQLERVVRAWGVPPRAAATAAEWRRLREFPGAAADAAAVYLARLFAIERLTPQFCAPGVIECAAEEMDLDRASLSSVREDPAVAALLQRLPTCCG